MRFKTFRALRTIWRDRIKLHPHVPPSGVNVQTTDRGVSIVTSKRVSSWDNSTANLHIVCLGGAFHTAGRNWAKIKVFKFQLHSFARRYGEDPIASGIIRVRNRVIRAEECTRKPTKPIEVIAWQTTYSRCFLCKEWKQHYHLDSEHSDGWHCDLRRGKWAVFICNENQRKQIKSLSVWFSLTQLAQLPLWVLSSFVALCSWWTKYLVYLQHEYYHFLLLRVGIRA